MIQASPTFIISLALTAHRQAERFRQHHGQAHKAKQVYLNTLAVYAVKEYLDYMGIETDLEASSSWSPIQQALMDTATLQVVGCGSLECRPILPNTTHLEWPPETSNESFGIVAVQLDPSLRSATLLGFARPSPTNIPLDNLQSLEELVQILCSISLAPAIPTHLSQWWNAFTNDVWTTVDNALELLITSPQYAFDYRTTRSDSPIQLSELPIVSRMKQYQLYEEPQSQAIQLLIGLQAISDQEMNIYAQVKAAEPQEHLPSDLSMAILDDDGNQIMQAQSLGTEALQMNFSSSVGEQFQLQLTLKETCIIEKFVT